MNLYLAWILIFDNAVAISCSNQNTASTAVDWKLQCVFFLVFVFFCLRWVQDVPAWLWNTTFWNQCRESLSTSCCSQVQTPRHAETPRSALFYKAALNKGRGVYWIMALLNWLKSRLSARASFRFWYHTGTTWTITVTETCLTRATDSAEHIYII